MLLTTSEVAKKLGCSADNVRKLEREGKLPAEKTPSGQRIFRLETVECLCKERAMAQEEKRHARSAA